MCGAARRRGVPPQPALRCCPSLLAFRPRPHERQDAPSQGASFAPLHLCFCSFANYALTHALLSERGGETQKTGSEHAAGFIW